MNTPDIIAEAKRRLAELDAEADKLRRMIAVADGTHVAPTIPVVPTQPFPWQSPLEPHDEPLGLDVTCGRVVMSGSTLDLTGSRPIGSNTVTIQN